MSKKQKVRKKSPAFHIVTIGNPELLNAQWISQVERKYPETTIHDSNAFQSADIKHKYTLICKVDDLPNPSEISALLKGRKELKAQEQAIYLKHKALCCLLKSEDWSEIKEDVDILDYRLRQLPFDYIPISVDSDKISIQTRQKGLGLWIKNWSNCIRWYFTQPLQNGFGKNPSTWRFLFASSLVVSLLALLIMSQQAGISGDEFRYHNQSAKVFKYFASGGAEKAAVTQSGIDPQHFNAQSFDVIMYTLEQWFGIEDRFDMRHFFNALIGWLGILFVGLLVSKLFGWEAALLAVILMFFSPRYFGHSLNNHRDIPSAVATITSLYYAILYFRGFPKPRLKHVIFLGLSVAAAFSIRLASGVLIVGLMGVFTALHLLTSAPKFNVSNIVTNLIRHAKYLIPTIIGGYLLGILLWPYGLEGPIKNALEVFSQSSNLGVSLRQVFDGEFVMSNQIPWYYVAKYLLISIPAVIFIGIASFLFRSREIWQGNKRFPIFILIFSVAFTLFYASAFVKNDYGGWRHFLFIYPPIVSLAAIGFNSLKSFLPEKARPFLIPICLVLALHPIRYTLVNHPYQYTYYNEFFGGIGNALGKFENDYSLNSMQEGIEWIIKNIKPETGEKVIIAANDPSQVRWGFRNDTAAYETVYVRYYEKYAKDWDYAVLTNLYVSPSQLREGYWPPANAIHEIKADDVVLTAVVKRDNKLDLEGHQAAQSGNHALAIEKFEAFLTDYPDNEQALATLSNSYLSVGNTDNALATADKALIAYPESIQALHVKGLSYMNKQDFENAELIYRQATKAQANNYAMHYYHALSLYNNKKIDQAIQAANMCIGLNGRFKQGFELMARMYEEKGQPATAQQYRQYMQNL